MDRTNAPAEMWFLAQQYLADVHNVCAHPLLQWNTPDQVAGGDTPDISHILMFYWFEPVLYLDPAISFPESKEMPGYFVGFAHNVGDFLTFKILKEDMKTVIHRSVVRSASDPNSRNRRVRFDDSVEAKLDKTDQEKLFKHEVQNKKKDDMGDLDDDEVEDAVSSRTRSKHHINGTLKAGELPQNSMINELLRALLAILTVILFSTFQIVNYTGSPSFFEPVSPTIIESLGMKERQVYNTAMKEPKWNDMKQLRYVQACDLQNDKEDPMNPMWECLKVVGHRMKKGTNGTQVEVKCQWKDPNKS